MLIGIFSDTHMGFGSGEQYEESFERLREALEILRQKKVSLVLHAGDLFDAPTPDQEAWANAFDAFSGNMDGETKVTKDRKGEESVVSVRGVPIIAIHGTHEFRGKGFTNALDVLEKAGVLVHLHAGKVIFEKDGEKVAVHGLGGVPEKNAKTVLKLYSPTPVGGMRNILLLHQSFKEFLPFDDEMIATLSLSDIPEGFDLVVGGHLHWSSEQEAEGKRVLLTGSTIFTQMKKLEGDGKKGVFTYDTKTGALEFIPFGKQRKMFYHKISFDSAKPGEVREKVEEQIAKDLSGETAMKPLIRLRLTGTLAKGFSQSDITLELPNTAIFSVSKEFMKDAFKKKMDSFKDEQLKKRGVAELGVEILEKNVEEAGLKGFDPRRIFELLAEGESEKAEKALLEE